MSLQKKVISLFIIFSSFVNLLYGDGEDIAITVSDASSVYEYSSKTSFEIKLNENPDLCDEVVVNYHTQDGTAKAGSDYNATSGSVTFYGYCMIPPRVATNSKIIDVPIINDSEYEDSENFYLKISSSTDGYSVTKDTGEAIIYSDDAKPLEATIHNRYENESDSNWTIRVAVELDQDAPEDITMHYTTQDGTAKAGSEYVAKSGTLNISKGSKWGYIDINIIGDLIPEDTKSFYVKIDSISKGTISRDTATVTIVDDDEIKVYVSGTDTKEGDINDSNRVPFKIYLSKDYPLDDTLTISYYSVDGSSPSATKRDDYTPISGSVTFKKGDREKIVYVPIIGDTNIEDDENIGVKIDGEHIKCAYSEAAILNDDGEFPALSFSDSSKFYIQEGNSSTRDLIFKLKLDKPAIAGSSFDYFTLDYSATVSDNDYIKIPTTTYTFKGGETEITIPVKVNGDTKIEDDEKLYLALTNAKMVKLNSKSASGYILNDDGQYPTIRFKSAQYSVVEGNSSSVDVNITMVLDREAVDNSSFYYRTLDDSAEVDDGDYVGISAVKYQLQKGQKEVVIPVKVNGDTKIEDDESFWFIIYNSNNLNICNYYASVYITNDDGSYPYVSITPSRVSVQEGDENSSKIVDFNISLDKPSIEDGAYIKFKTYDATATANSLDYEEIPETKVVFNRGEISKSFSVRVYGDVKVEDDEYFYIKLFSAYHLKEGSDRLKISILNDDTHSNSPFECNEGMYISSSTNRETGETNRMWLHKIDTTTNPFEFRVLDDNGTSKLYNATAYNPDDNYIYGLYFRNLVKLTKSGMVVDLGKIDALPEIYDSKQLYAGAIYNGYYFVTGRNTKQNIMYKIKLSDKSVTPITLSKYVAIQDFSFLNEGNQTKYLYGIDKDGKLTRIDSTNGDVVQIGQDHIGYAFDSSFSDKNGRFFANDSNGHGFFEFNLLTGEKRFLSDSQPATYNDGANCINAELIFTDYSDAPTEMNEKHYGVAWHNIAGGIYLGDRVDHDIKNYSNDSATGDDTNGTNDDDGITLADGSPLQGAYLEDNKTHQLKVKLSKSSYLRIWIDLDIDNHFDNGHDLVYDGNLSAGVHTIDISLPDGLTTHTKTYLRARVSSVPAMDYQGFLLDGEVEDYMIYFGKKDDGLEGVFNVERTNSGLFDINTEARNAWFTQVVGRDFDYSLLFYETDMSKEKELSRVVVKISLIDEDTNSSIYDKYAYINDPKSRIDNLIPDDLNRLPATRRARFRVYYGVDNRGKILQTSCNLDPKICFEALPKVAYNDARDDFSIRPAYFHVTLLDGNETRRVNISPYNSSPLRVASGYDYNLVAVASIYNGTDKNSSLGYSSSTIRALEFLDKNLSACSVKRDFNSTISFVNGNSHSLLRVPEVGRYRLHISDSNWTQVDRVKGDCDINKSYISNDPNIISGCDISDIKDINLSSYPHHFDLNLHVVNLPASSHSDFIYMSDLNSTFNSVALSFRGDILAKNRDGSTTKNFTCGCFGEDILLDLNITTLSENGENRPIKTIKGSSILFTKLVDFNHDSNFSIDKNETLAPLSITTISKDRFRDDDNGTLYVDIRYNISKSLFEPTNPIQLKVHNADVNSSDSYSISEGRDSTDPYIPAGTQNLGDVVKNFYCARVSPDKRNFPEIDFNKVDFVRTPMQVEIFCGVSVPLSYCIDTNLTSHTLKSSSPRAQQGWYISIDHNETFDGNITKLIPDDPDPNVVTFSTLNSPTFPITFKKGKNGTIITKFSNPTGTKSYRIFVYPSPQLMFSDKTSNGIDYFVVSGSDVNSSWTGVGSTGRTLEIKSNNRPSNKLDW
jgi:hypothetical protein